MTKAKSPAKVPTVRQSSERESYMEKHSLKEFARRGGKVTRVFIQKFDTPMGLYIGIDRIEGLYGVYRKPCMVTGRPFGDVDAVPAEDVNKELTRWAKREGVYAKGLGLLDIDLRTEL